MFVFFCLFWLVFGFRGFLLFGCFYEQEVLDGKINPMKAITASPVTAYVEFERVFT